MMERTRTPGSRSLVLTAWLAVASCSTLVFPAGAQSIAKPELFGKSLRAAKEAFEYYGTVDDSEAQRRVVDIGYEVAVQSDYRDMPFSFYVIEMPVPNAFALPGGQIFVTSGMLDLGLSDDMLACLLGHEIAHVTREHGTRIQKRATLLNVLSQALLVGVMVGVDDEPENPYDPYGRTGSRKGSLVQGAAATGMVLSELLLRNYSREFEDEADVEGQRLAAAAGYDPDGARQLWELMNKRIPQANEYGYWRTHPFSDTRMRAAEVRATELKIQENPRPSEDYRAETQKVLLDYRRTDFKKKDEGLGPFLELSGLSAWPKGPKAEELRLAALHRQRDAELERDELSRDYGELVRAYRVQIEEVRALTPDTAFLATLESEMHDLRDGADGLLEKALEVWEEGFYQTPFLEVFLSNYPTVEVAPDVALALGNAYSRLGRQADGVSQFLRAIEAGPDSEAGRQALQGLRNLAPYLDKPAALQQLHDEIDDEKLREVSRQRLNEVAGSYEDLADGADYLKRFPAGEHAGDVGDRLEELAQNLYGEVVLYQGVGDHIKALDRIQQILTHAPMSRAAEAVRDRAVLDS